MKKTLTILVLLTAFMVKGEAFAHKASKHRHAPHSQGEIAAMPPASNVKASHSPGCEKNRETRLRDCTTNCTPSGCKKNNELAKECSKLCEGHGNSVSDWLYKKCSLAMVGIESNSLSTGNSNQLTQTSSSETISKQDLRSHSPHGNPLSPAYGRPHPTDPAAAQRYELTKPAKSALTKKRAPQAASSKDIIQSQSHTTREKLIAPSLKEKIGSSGEEATLAERNLESQSLTETP